MGVEDRYKKKREEEEKSNTLYNGVENRYLYKNAETIGKEITNRVNTWLTNNNNYISNAQNRFSGNNTRFRTDASDWLTTVTSQRENFQKEAESIKSVLTQYKDFFGDDYVNSVFEALDGNLKAQESVLDVSTKDVEYWAQWASEDEYYTAQRILGYQNKYDGKSYEEIVAALGKLKDGEEKEWLNAHKYEYVKYSPDYENNSTSGWETYLTDAEKKQQEALYGKEDEKWYEKIGRWLGSTGATDTTLPMGTVPQVTHDLREDTSYMEPASNWTDEQKAIYGYLYETDRGAANAYAQATTEANNQAEKEQKLAAIEEWSTKNGFNGAVATLASIALTPMSLVDTLDALVQYNARGFVSTSATPMPGEISNAVTGAISSALNEKGGTLDDSIPVVGGKGLGDAYQLGVSIANSMLTAYTQGAVGTYVVFFGSASASGMHEAKDRGATDEQAITYGILSGLAEAAGEAFSVDNLLSIAGAKELSSFFLSILKQAGIEASEEGVTTLLNNFADQLVMGDKSNFNAIVELFMTQEGLSEEEAKKKAWLSMANDLAFDMLGGAISGGISGGIQSGIGSVINSANNTALGKEYKAKFGADIGGALATEATEIDPNSKFAQRMQNKVDSGKSLSNRQVGKLVQQNEAAMYKNDVAAIQSAAENRLTELGETGNVKAIAAALVKQVQGERLTFTEREAIKSSKFGQRVANELNTENIKSGEYSASWAEKIGTDRINAEEYGKLLQSLDAESKPTTAVAPDTNVGHKATVAAEAKPAAEIEQNADENTAAKESPAEAKIEASDEVANTDESTVTLESASKKYGAQSGAMISTYTEGQDVAKYDAAYSAAYNMGKSGVALSYAMNSGATAYLTESQRKLAHAAGADASSTTAKAQAEANKAKANGKTGRRKGTVRGEGVKIEDLRKSFNDTQGKAYKLLTTYAEATGIDIVLYKSEANADGKFEGAQGKFKWSEDTIYIDINAGIADIKSVDDLAKYTMMRTFSHEFTHFIEKWNPVWYNEFRKVVFDTLTERGENVEALIETKQAQNEGMTYDKASREVVAEAMTDILPDANFVEDLANNHKTIFAKLLEKLKEFVADLKAYFSSIDPNSSREANALKEQIGEGVKYVENIVKLFDKVAVEAVTNYQATVATDIETETNTDGGINHAEQETAGSERQHVQGAGSLERTQSKESNGQGVSGEIRQNEKDAQREADTLRERRRELSQKAKRYPDDAFIAPQEGSVEAEELAKLAAYGVEGYVVKKSVWTKKEQAFSNSGRVYFREGMDEVFRGVAAAHEATHVMNMKQLHFRPYLDFLERTPDMLDLTTSAAADLLGQIEEGREADMINADEDQQKQLILDVYDEFNAAVFGHYVGGKIDAELQDTFNEAFYDFDAYIKELSDIHEQFKEANAPKKVAEATAKVEATTETEATESEADGSEFTITDNREYGTLEIKFDGKPSEAIRDVLKDKGFRWHRTKQIWYGKGDRSDIVKALREAYQSETTAEETAPTTEKTATETLREMGGKAVGGNMTDVTDLFFPELAKPETPNAEKAKPVRTKKSDWASHDVEWRVPGKKTPIAYSTVAASDLIEALAEDNPSATIKDLLGKVTYDAEAKKVLQQYIDAGYSDQVANEWFNHNKKENANVENVDNRGTVQQSDADRQGNTRVLDEVQTDDVQRDAPRGDSVGDAVERGQETGRDGSVADNGTGTGGRSGDGDRQSGDLRRNDELTPEAERLHEEVTEQIAQQSTEQPKGRNFVIGDSLDLPNGEKARYKANIEAIKLVKQLEAENRYATEAEQQILSKYVGWGGLSNVFDKDKSEWANEFAELKKLLTDEEYRAASASTTDAFYTDIPVIKAMYDGLAKLGFTGGRMLEPSSGVGNFVGAMPTEMSAKVNSWTMVELDRITGLIAKYLYPNADVRIQGFEKFYIPDNYMDVAIGNVPFGNVGVYDKAYPKRVTKSIHNYFFAKALDKVRPGGIVMFITSSGTMNGSDKTVRDYIMGKADLLGAIRLPNTAFKGNASTNVVSDILILKKRADNTAYAGEDFLNVSYDYKIGETTNDYFTKHPEMVLGVAELTRGQYGRQVVTYKPFTDRGSLADQIREAFSHIEGKMEYPATLSREKTNFAVERANKKTKENGLVVKDGKVYQNKGGELVEVDKAKGAVERITGMLEIRDLARNLMNYQQQGLNETEIKKARKALNTAYDAFVKKYGFINSQANRNAFTEDPDRYSLFALENWNPETKQATKADIFSKNTIAPNRTITSAKDVSEGLIVSVNQTGGVDTALIARLTGMTEADVTRELIDSRKAFKNRNGDLEAAETYLSGNVRAKLRDAEALVPIDGDYANNVEALKAVMPADVGYQDIFVNPGTPWIPNSVYSDFAAHMLGSRNSEWRQAVDVTRNAETGNFTVELKDAYLKYNAANTQKWGTSRRTFLELFDAMLNSKSVVIKDKLDDGSSVINKDATAAANEKIENITKEFQEWLWKDEARRTELATLYNEVFNSIVTPKYNGDNLTVNGANALKPLRPHQRNAVQRVISSGGNTLLAHKVGAGKTYEMAAAAMKLKELGLVKKPMFAVPKSLVAQWGNEFIDFFPTAKLLVAEASDFSAANRKVFMNRIANGEYDAVIVSYEQFEKLPMSDDFTRQLYQEQIDSVIAAIEEAKADKGNKALSVKDLEKKRKSLQTKIDRLTDKAKDEGNIDFEQLGVDSLFVDEAHNFKNLFYTTSMTNVAGLGNKDGSKRAFDLYTKVRYLQQLNGGRGIVFATATPVMNSMSEMYIMQKYLQPDLLNQLGLSPFDAWAKQFGEVVNGVEIKPSGQGYRVKQSFSRFKNMSELQLLFRNFADVLTDIPGLKIPKMKGGKVNVVVCEPGQFQQDFMKELEQRADNIKNVDPSVDNMLKITSDGRKISYTQRMIDPSLPYEEGCKIFRCADNVIKEYNDSKTIKGTQIIFCDMATPKGKSDNTTDTEDIETDMESAQLYDDLKTRLRQGGIPAKEIAFIHEADTDQKKKKLFADVNDGKVRVLIGSTGKMGVGMNAQKRIVAIHHLDAPWRPGDVEQRDGRAFRQGNINDEVSKYTYVTEGSFDARLWDILDRKQNFINQIMNGESVGRDAEDTGEVTLSAAEVKALASGSPLIMEQVQLDTDIKKLESLYRAHVSAVRSAKERLLSDSGKIAILEKQIDNGEADMLATVDTYSEGRFSMTVGNKQYADKKEAGVALMAAAAAKATPDGYTKVGTFAGFELRVIRSSEGISGLLVGKQGYPFKTYPGNHAYMTNHIIGVVESIEEKVKLWRHNLTELQTDIAEQEKLIAAPFAKQAELDQKRARYNEVMEILNPKEEQSLDSVDEDTVQEQSRAYLSAGGKAVMTKDRIDYLIADSGAGMRKDYAQGWITSINPTDFLNLTLMRSNQDRAVFDTMPGDYGSTVNDYDYIEGGLKKERRQTPYLAIDVDTGDVVGHEGRHRMRALEKEGVTYAEIKIEFRDSDGRLVKEKNGYGNPLETISSLEIFNQRGTGQSAIIRNIIPLNNANRDNIFQHYGAANSDDIQYQQRTTTLGDREVLALAADALEQADIEAASLLEQGKLKGAKRGDLLTDAERDALQIFRDRLTRLEELQGERAEQGRLYKEQQFGAKVDREAAAQTLNRMHVLDDQIKAASAAVLSVEDKKVLADVLKKARKVVEAEQRSNDAEILKRYRDRTRNAAAIKKYRERIKTDVNELITWVMKPDNKDIVKHIPDVLKNSVIPFLNSIDFMSKQQLRGGEATKADAELVKRLNALNGALKEQIEIDGLYSGYTDLPPNFMQDLQNFIDAVQELVKQNSGEFVINKMTSEELKQLSGVVRTLKAYITQINKFHANAMYAHVYEAGDNTIEALSPMASDNGKSNTATNFVFWQQIRPAFAFERFGNGGIAIYDGLRRGQARLAFNTQKIVEFAEKAYTSKEVNAWEKETKDIRISSGTVKMRISDMMSLYELSKQPDSLRHMLGEGMRVATYTAANGKKISDNGHALNEGDVAIIVNALTQRQKEVADAMQKFMQEQGGAWGNEVSVRRFGEELFTNEHYFPINSDGRHLQATADEHPSAASLYALLNMSFTKSRNEKANNRIIVYSIFDVFANHMASMAQYNAMALPVLDAIKWFNYQQKTEDHEGNRYVKDSVREQMARVYGVSDETRPGAGKRGYAEDFVLGILKAFNGTEAQGIPADTFGMNALRRYNMAQVAFNFRVVVQQPLAITRAALLIDYGSIVRGMKLSPAAIKQNIAEMQKYSGIAAWKSLGFYDVNISRGVTDTIKHSTTVGQQIGEIGMWGAEQADTLTWAAMWSACKEDVIKKQKLRPGDEGFYEAVTKLFEDVIYKTQVVDSILTKNEFLRSKGLGARIAGSFMSEPTTTASMLIDAVDKYHADMKRGMTKQQAWEKNKHMIGRTLYVYALSAVMLAAVQAIADAWRDDDEYETFIEKWLEAFGGNAIDELMPVNKLPILSDFYDLAKELLSIFGVDTYGNPPTSVYMQWYDSLVKGTEIIYQKIAGVDTNYTWYGGIYKLFQAVSGIVGLPMAATTREIIAIWNNTVGAMAPSLKVKSYDSGDMGEIKYAYEDGYLTFDEATAELLEQGLVENENEAYFTVSGWEAGDGYSRYDKVYDAVRNGASVDEAMNELVSHGYTEKQVIGQITSKVGEWYKGGEISKQQATDMLTKYTDKSSEDIAKTVNKWSSYVVTGIEYNDIGDEVIAGNITASRAIEMYMRYGGMSKEDATNQVSVYTFIKDHPSLDGESISYSFVSAYKEYCEPQGIDVDVFHDVWQYKGSAKADTDKHGKIIPDSAKQKVLAYIESLGLSKKQMDGLYYALGYAKSTIKDAPWH